MKLQGMAILYVIIIIPMLIVISLTLSEYKEQLNNNFKYDLELTGAVNDAITAFELNSASQDFSNVSDNFTSIVEASVNIFRRSIATRLNMTNADESLMNRYFPLALFTGYSGYYIYSPTYAPVVVRNPYTGQAVFSSDAVNKNDLDKDSGVYTPSENINSLQYTPVLLKHKNHNNYTPGGSVQVTTKKDLVSNKLAKEEIDYSLKQLIPYTIELEIDKDNKILLNFTLDNYISFTGKVKGIAYNKSGYLLNNNTSIELKQGNDVIYNLDKIRYDLKISHLTYFDEYVDDYIENKLTKGNKKLVLTVKEGDNVPVSIVFNPVQYRIGRARYIEDKREQMTGQYAYQRQQLDAIKYYIKAANFSNFVYKNLNLYEERNIKGITLPNNDKKYEKYFLKYDENSKERIFPTSKNILDYNSTFNEVKRKAIRNSVQYDLIISTTNYNYLVSSSDFILNLPVITDYDWERIIENISFTAFLQGLPIGSGKNYSNYAVATSTMNEFVINPDTIYFSDIQGFNQGHIGNLKDDELYYHKINCKDFLDYLKKNDPTGDEIGSGAIGFKLGEWMYDARWSREEAKYIYDHKNYSHFNCITNHNVIPDKNLEDIEKKIINKNIMAAVAAEKERSFKSNKITDGGGYKISFSSGVVDISKNRNIKSFEIATKNTKIKPRKYVISISAKGKTKEFTVEQQNSVASFPSYSTTYNTNKYKVHSDFINDLITEFGQLGQEVKWKDISAINISVKDPDTSVQEPLEYVKAIYF